MNKPRFSEDKSHQMKMFSWYRQKLSDIIKHFFHRGKCFLHTGAAKQTQQETSQKRPTMEKVIASFFDTKQVISLPSDTLFQPLPTTTTTNHY